MKYGIRKQIEDRISKMKDSDVFVIEDFSDIAENKTASKTLGRMCEEKIIEKLMRGVYRKSSYGEVEPNNIARALARENSWKSIPCGETVLHLFGLLEKAPHVWTYISNGTYRTYSVMGHDISFAHTTIKGFNKMSEKASTLVEIIRAYGESGVPTEKIKEILSHFKPGELTDILAETKNCPKWIYQEIKKLFMHGIKDGV